jgi:hypothetical protein
MEDALAPKEQPMETDPKLILFPIFGIFLLIGLVLTRLAILRVGAVSRREVPLGYYTTYQAGEEPAHIRVVTRNFLNLFEMPVLFYVVAILIYVTRQTSPWLVGGAWLYVALRFAHTVVHLTSNRVPLRFRIYFASNLVLLTLWLAVFVKLLQMP